MIIFYILLIAHFLADFTFQPAFLAVKKNDKFGFFIIHTLIYAVTFSLAIFLFLDCNSVWLPYILIVISHFIIDFARKLFEKKFGNKAVSFFAFLADQLLHILILVLIFNFFELGAKTNQLYGDIGKWEYFNGLIVYLLIFVIIWEPSAVFIKKFFTYIINGNSCAAEENDPQIGRIIGKLERIIISALVLLNQFGAIGFVVAAKSIARFKQLEDKNFAEKYLVGTLISVSIAFIISFVLKQLAL